MYHNNLHVDWLDTKDGDCLSFEWRENRGGKTPKDPLHSRLENITIKYDYRNTDVVENLHKRKIYYLIRNLVKREYFEVRSPFFWSSISTLLVQRFPFYSYVPPWTSGKLN